MSPRAVWEVDLALPRHAFTARDTVRAGDIWRLFQEAAVEAACRAGWPPERFRETRTGFVVRSMTVRHHREATYAERDVMAKTWVWGFRREMLSRREVRLSSPCGPVASATQEWVHVDDALRPTRASPELIAAFPGHESGELVDLPAWTEHPGPRHTWSFECWYTWMDPLDHANHPDYLDWCDESASRVVADAGLRPVDMQPIAERVAFRAAVNARDRVTVFTERTGLTPDGDLVLAHRVVKEDGTRCADATTIRRLVGVDPSVLVDAFD